MRRGLKKNFSATFTGWKGMHQGFRISFTWICLLGSCRTGGFYSHIQTPLNILCFPSFGTKTLKFISLIKISLPQRSPSHFGSFKFHTFFVIKLTRQILCESIFDSLKIISLFRSQNWKGFMVTWGVGHGGKCPSSLFLKFHYNCFKKWVSP